MVVTLLFWVASEREEDDVDTSKKKKMNEGSFNVLR